MLTFILLGVFGIFICLILAVALCIVAVKQGWVPGVKWDDLDD